MCLLSVGADGAGPVPVCCSTLKNLQSSIPEGVSSLFPVFWLLDCGSSPGVWLLIVTECQNPNWIIRDFFSILVVPGGLLDQRY